MSKFYFKELELSNEEDYFFWKSLPRLFLVQKFNLDKPFHFYNWIRAFDENGEEYIEVKNEQLV